jgi:hypothetical protein
MVSNNNRLAHIQDSEAVQVRRPFFWDNVFCTWCSLPSTSRSWSYHIFKGQWIQLLMKMSAMSKTCFTNMVHVPPNTKVRTNHHLFTHVKSCTMHMWEQCWKLVFWSWQHNFVDCMFGTNWIATTGNCWRQWWKKKYYRGWSIIHYTANLFLLLRHKITLSGRHIKGAEDILIIWIILVLNYTNV